MRYSHALRSSPAGKAPSTRFCAKSTDLVAFGARLALVPTEHGVKYEFFPQVGFYREGASDCEWVIESELTDENLRRLAASGCTHTRFLVRDDRDEERLRAKMERVGFAFGAIEDQRIAEGRELQHARITTTIDSTVRRAVAKIAFNYFVWASGDAELALRSDFDPIRNYIRFGVSAGARELPLIQITNDCPIDTRRPGQRRLGSGHMITVTWNTSLTGLLAHVMLFRTFNYKVLLCPTYSGVWFDFKKAHHFDLNTKEAHELRATYLVP